MEFLRRIHNRYSKLGKRRKKKQIWRRPTGRDNKMRERRRGYPARVQIGYKKGPSKEFNVIKNPKELEKIEKNSKVIVGNIGKKKKIEIVKKANEMKIKLHNLNIKQFLKQNKKKKVLEKTETKEKKKNEPK